MGLHLWPGSPDPLRGEALSEGSFRELLSPAVVLRMVGLRSGPRIRPFLRLVWRREVGGGDSWGRGGGWVVKCLI